MEENAAMVLAALYQGARMLLRSPLPWWRDDDRKPGSPFCYLLRADSIPIWISNQGVSIACFPDGKSSARASALIPDERTERQLE